MLWRLYGERGSSLLKMEWVPLGYQIVKVGSIFNWAHIPSTNIMLAVRRAKESPLGNALVFFMPSSLIDVICDVNMFPLMKWHGTPSQVHVHI